MGSFWGFEAHSIDFHMPLAKGEKEWNLRIGMRKIVVLLFTFLFLCMPSLSRSEDGRVIECEVMEAAAVAKGAEIGLERLHYLLIHHAHERDRVELSKCLKAFNGREVEFAVKGIFYRGIIFRLSHCFGRGLLLYRGDFKVERKEIILVKFPKIRN